MQLLKKHNDAPIKWPPGFLLWPHTDQALVVLAAILQHRADSGKSPGSSNIPPAPYKHEYANQNIPNSGFFEPSIKKCN